VDVSSDKKFVSQLALEGWKEKKFDLEMCSGGMTQVYEKDPFWNLLSSDNQDEIQFTAEQNNLHFVLILGRCVLDANVYGGHACVNMFVTTS